MLSLRHADEVPADAGRTSLVGRRLALVAKACVTASRRLALVAKASVTASRRPTLVVGVGVTGPAGLVLRACDRLPVERFIDRRLSPKTSKLLAHATRTGIERRPAARAEVELRATGAAVKSGAAARAVQMLHGDAD